MGGRIEDGLQISLCFNPPLCYNAKQSQTRRHPFKVSRLGVSSVHQYAFFIAWQAYHDTTERVKQEKQIDCTVHHPRRNPKGGTVFCPNWTEPGPPIFLDLECGWMRKRQLNGVGV